MKHSFNYDFTVQARRQERDEEPEVALFYEGIYSVALNTFVDVMFIPYFSRDVEDWSLRIPLNIDKVYSWQEARLFTAALSDVTVTPDEYKAGNEELIALPSPHSPSMKIGQEMGLIFYVTNAQFALFSQELAEIEKQAFSLYDSVPVSSIADFESIRFILNRIMICKHFPEESLKILGRHKKMTTSFSTNGYQVNGGQIHGKRHSPAAQRRPLQTELAVL